MKIVIEFIPGEQQRYPTCGDYWIDADGNWQIRVSRMQDWRSEIAVAMHELWELALVLQREIPIDQIDRFDMDFELFRPTGSTAEPGDDPRAPYYEEHASATAAEQQLCEALRLPWAIHDKHVNDA